MLKTTAHTIRVYCLASFTEDEADEILTQLDDDSHHSYSAADVRVELIPWTAERDGGKEDIFRLFLENQDTEEDFMFFIDRSSLEWQDFVVADVRSAKRSTTSTGSSANWSIIESTRDGPALNQSGSCSGPQILFGRCGQDTGWYGNSYSGIKTIYTNLISGHVTLDSIIHQADTRSTLLSERRWISSALDACDESYSAQAQVMKQQAELLCCDLNAASIDNSEGYTHILPTPPHSGRNSFSLSSKRWVLQV